MSDTELIALLDSVSHVAVQQYLRSRQWKQNASETREGIFAVYDADDVQVDVPLNPKLGDYRRRLHEAVELIAAHESRSALDLSRALLEPAGDTIALRVATKGTRSGTLALADSIDLREAVKGLLLAAAHSEIEARPYYARLSRAPALKMLAKVREAQTAHGSFVSRCYRPDGPGCRTPDGVDGGGTVFASQRQATHAGPWQDQRDPGIGRV